MGKDSFTPAGAEGNQLLLSEGDLVPAIRIWLITGFTIEILFTMKEDYYYNITIILRNIGN